MYDGAGKNISIKTDALVEVGRADEGSGQEQMFAVMH